MKQLKELGIDEKIVFLGDGPYLEKFRGLAQELEIQDNCIFEKSRANVCDYITASYINILTSRWEGLPTVIIEAMSLGKPCVMTNNDNGEVSCNGKYCMLVPVDDVNAVCESLAELYTNRDIYNKFCSLSLERAKDFDPAKIKMQFKNLLEK